MATTNEYVAVHIPLHDLDSNSGTETDTELTPVEQVDEIDGKRSENLRKNHEKSTPRPRRNRTHIQNNHRARHEADEINPDAEIIPKPKKPPIAESEFDHENDDDDDDDEKVNKDGGSNGVDDGFDEEHPLRPEHPHRHPDEDHNDGFPYAPGFPHYSPGTSVVLPDGTTMPDINIYQHKKTLAQGMMDLALLSANANQLRYVLESYKRHPYYYVSLYLISFSLIMQILVGIGLILNSRYNVKNRDDICTADRINNFTILGIFLVTVVNVFISAFGVADPVDQEIRM